MDDGDRGLERFIQSMGFELPDVEDVYVFHESTKAAPSTSVSRNLQVDGYLRSPRGALEQSSNRKNYDAYPSTILPEPPVLHAPLGEVFDKRRSVRQFEQRPLALETLSGVLASLRVNRTMTATELPDVKLYFKPYPSGGALFPIEVYVLAFDVAALDRAVYHYDSRAHLLHRVAELPSDDQVALALDDRNRMLKAANAVFLLTMVPKRSLVKYGSLGYRLALIEAGIVGQQLSLAAVALGLGSLLWAGYFDDLSNDILHVDGVEETVVNALWLGTKAAE